ncbi:unnamed protein product, partial [marine sediment metagenome]
WSHGDLSGNEELVFDVTSWTGSIILDDSLNNLVYTVQVNDASENYVRGSEQSIPVDDNDNPVVPIASLSSESKTGLSLS